MTLITFQDGQVVMRDGQVGTEQGCCCQEQECCCTELYSFGYTEAIPDRFMSLRSAEVSALVVPMPAEYAEYLDQVTRREDAPDRPCPVVPYRLGRATVFDGVFLRREVQIKFFTADCTTDPPSLIDVTSDYNEPDPPDLAGFDRIGPWTFSQGSYENFPDDSPTVDDLLPWPEDPQCQGENPLP